MKRLPILLIAAALAACTPKQPVVIKAADTCPRVPQCTAAAPDAIETNADLVRALTAYRAAFEQCRLYRDTLSACLKPEQEAAP